MSPLRERPPHSPPGSPQTDGLVRGLGPLAATALVAGNIIASGIYVVPGALAEMAGPVSLVAWIANAIGYVCLTAVFADLGEAYPHAGGPQVFVRRAFGDLAGIVAAFLYWLSAVVGNAAFLTAFVGYLAVFVPAAAEPVHALFVAQVLLWSLTLVNVIGVKTSGKVQLLSTILKIVPLLLVAAALLFHGSADNLQPFAPKGLSPILPAIALVSWLFLGTESVTVAAEEVVGAGPAIRRSAYRGFALATAIYLLVAFALAFGLPAGTIAGSASPLAVAAREVIGPAGETIITAGALISIAGALNGWLLVTGRLPFAAAREGIAPPLFARIDRRFGTPAVSLVVSSAATGLLVLLYFERSLLEAYDFIALAATATALLAIAGACAAQLALVKKEPERFAASARRRGAATALLGLFVIGAMLLGAGRTVVLLALAAAVIPIAFHFARRARRARVVPGAATPTG